LFQKKRAFAALLFTEEKRLTPLLFSENKEIRQFSQKIIFFTEAMSVSFQCSLGFSYNWFLFGPAERL
jgi:hypothetical protein